jgi:hypothetical protein
MKMISSELAFQVSVALISTLAMVCFFGFFEEEIQRIFSTFYHLLIRPITLINDFLGAFWLGVRRFYRDQFSENGQLDLQKVFFQFIGAVLYSAFFIVFSYAELHLLALSLAALDFDTGNFSAPMGAGTLTALAIIASFLFWGAILLDVIGVTNTGPWRDALDKRGGRYLLCVTLFFIGLSLFVVGSFGLLRHIGLADESFNPQGYSLENSGGISDSSPGFNISNPSVAQKQPPGTIDKFFFWIPIITGGCVPILIGIGGVLAGWGVITLIKFIMLAAGFLIISPLGLLYLTSILLLEIVQRLLDFVYAVIQLFAAMGNRFMGIFRRQPPGANPPPGPNDPDDNGPDHDAFSQQNNQASSADQKEEPMSPSKEGWDPINKKGD